MKKLKVILVGAGARGICYTDKMADMPEKFEVVGVAETNESRREYIKEKHNIKEEFCFNTWEDILKLPKFADIALIATMDRMHFAPTMEAIRKGYDILLEKPIAVTAEECVKIGAEAKKYGVKFLVCHVLRYTPYFRTLKKLIDDGEIGKIMSIQHSECVGNMAQVHNFVRGNWGNTQRSSPMILQKSCHDMDILQWLIGCDCKKVTSFGSLSYFTPENAPEGSTEYCLDGCPHADTCYYNAENIYLNTDYQLIKQVCTGLMDPSDEDIIHTLKTTRWGKCAFKCDNDVVDRQVVNMEFEDGTVVDFNMCAFNKGGRFIRIMGTKGEIVRSDEDVFLYRFSDKSKTKIDIESFGNTQKEGHGGGDLGIVNALYDYVAKGISSDQLSEVDISVKNHMIAFAAEEARLSGKIIDLDEYIASIQ